MNAYELEYFSDRRRDASNSTTERLNMYDCHRGYENEAVVGRALDTVKRRQEARKERAESQLDEGGAPRQEPTRPKGQFRMPCIKKITHADPNSNLDRQGIDFLIELEDGKQVPLQVKSNNGQKRKFENRHRRFKEFIPVIVVNYRDACEPERAIWRLVRRIMKCIKQFLIVVSRAQIRISQRINEQQRKSSRKLRCFRYFAPSMCH